MDADLDRRMLLELLAELGRRANLAAGVELTVVGGSAGILTGQLSGGRTTTDCDVIRTEPPEEWDALRDLAARIAGERGLPDAWLSDRVSELDVLPAGWRKRRVHAGTFGRLRVLCAGRLDLLAMKAYAGRIQDRADFTDMRPTAGELGFVRRYLDQLRVPGRRANLDQIQSAVRFVDALEESLS